MKNKPEPGRTKVLNPVTEFLTLLFPENSFESGVRNFNLFDINGKSYSKLKMDVPEPIISISLGSVPPGLYLLRIEFKDNVQILKVIITR